jgi:hypothetical protein
MEEQLEIAILAGANDQEIEELLLHNIIGVEENNAIQPVEFNLNNMSDDEVKANFRFQREDIIRLRNALRIPQRVISNTRNKVAGNVKY